MAQFQDVRRITHANRVRTGFFEDYTAWREAPATFAPHNLQINGHPVMEDWEDGYMKELAEIACARGGRVLEVGFGMGISARYVQAREIAEHLIVECNRDVFVRLLRFAEGARRPVTPLFGFWQEATRNIPSGSISGILFDTYPLTEREIHKNHFDFFEEAFRLLEDGGVFTYYSDEINSFSLEHIDRLRSAGFTCIEKKICRVKPPKDCEYWRSNTIVAPIITK